MHGTFHFSKAGATGVVTVIEMFVNHLEGRNLF
jgi:hypothetical protein